VIPALVVCQSSDVKVVAFADLGHLRDQIAVRPLRKVFVHRELGLLAWNHVDLVAHGITTFSVICPTTSSIMNITGTRNSSARLKARMVRSKQSWGEFGNKAMIS